MSLQEQASQSGLVLLEETTQWNQNDWPPLVGGWRKDHASVVLNHPGTDNDNNNMGQTVVVLGGYHQQDQDSTNSALVLNLADPDMQWREGPPMNKTRLGHAAVVCNGGVYVMGGYNDDRIFDCLERIDVNVLLQSSLTTTTTTQEGHWTTLICRLSTKRRACCAVAVHNRYIVISGGLDKEGTRLSSVDIIETSNHTFTPGPSMNGPRSYCASAVVGNRIFVVGGYNEQGYIDSVEYLEFAKDVSFSSVWTTHSDLVLSEPRGSSAMVTVGSCLVVAGGSRQIITVDVLDTHRNRVWNLPPFPNYRVGFTLVTVANQVAVIGGMLNHSCATYGIVDTYTWCFLRLCKQHVNGCFHSRQGMHIGDINATSCTSSTSIRMKTNT